MVISDFLSKTFLLKNINPETIESALKNISPQITGFLSGEIIYEPEKFEEKVGFVISGECTVERIKTDGAFLPLNSLKPTDSFGILALFSDDGDFPTRIRAKKQTDILFLSKEDCINLILANPQISLNIIKFMSDRIKFLNNKIATFSADNVEQKLAQYILIESRKNNSDQFFINCKKTAEMINSGRASLYRAIDSLCERGTIKFENKKIYISDREGLERMTK